MRIWYLHEPISYREQHPTVAAEAWYAETLKIPLAAHGIEAGTE